MPRRAVQLVLVWVAMAMVLLVPAFARAAIVPACESYEFSGMPRPEPRPESLCTPVSGPDEAQGDFKVAPMCDERGASAVAPPYASPVSDARIEASAHCDLGSSAPHIGPSPKHPSPIAELSFALEPAVLAAEMLFSPLQTEPLPAYPPVLGEARPGIQQSVFRPPR